MNGTLDCLNLILRDLLYICRQADLADVSSNTVLSNDEVNNIIRWTKEAIKGCEDIVWDIEEIDGKYNDVHWFHQYYSGIIIKKFDRGYAAFYFITDGVNTSYIIIDDTYNSDASIGTDSIKEIVKNILMGKAIVVNKTSIELKS